MRADDYRYQPGGVSMIKRCLLLFVMLASVSTACLADDESTLRHLKTVLWPKAYLTQDAELLDQLLHDSFELIDDDGTRSSKQDELDYITNNKWSPGNFEYTIERLDIFDGAFAIVSGTGTADNYTYKSSNVLIKVGGQWRAVASHVSGYRTFEL
jgi:hypothetical protein